MNFRCLRDFNIALLGNQAWRLMVYPHRLVSKVFKARYYSNGSILTASLGSNPSYIWRSIFETQSLISHGTARRIGKGQDTFILNSPWLPLVEDPYVHSTSEALINQNVLSLMSIGGKLWDEDLILDVFNERDASLILSIPLDGNDKDTWYWWYEKLGFYSVKSAYVHLHEAKRGVNMANNSGFWRKLWQLKIPSKIKNFLWRAATGCLPTRDLLRVKHDDVNPLCLICNVVTETICHALFSCPFADNCYRLFPNPILFGNASSFAEWLQELFEHRQHKEIHNQVVLCWLLWKNRNDTIMEAA